MGHGEERGTLDALVSAIARVASVKRVESPTDRATGKMRGFSFLTFSTPDDATRVVSSFARYRVEEVLVRLEFARERRERRGGDSTAPRPVPTAVRKRERSPEETPVQRRKRLGRLTPLPEELPPYVEYEYTPPSSPVPKVMIPPVVEEYLARTRHIGPSAWDSLARLPQLTPPPLPTYHRAPLSYM